jgi:hypothetical protein
VRRNIIQLGGFLAWCASATMAISADLPVAEMGSTSRRPIVDLFDKSLGRDAAAASVELGTRIHWLEPPILLQAPTDPVKAEKLYGAMNLIVDTIPLNSEVYVPTLDRLSNLFEEALYDPFLANGYSLSKLDEGRLQGARDALFLKYSGDPMRSLSASPRLKKALLSLGSGLGAELALPASESGSRFEAAIFDTLSKYRAWSSAHRQVVHEANTLASLYRLGNAHSIRAAKINFETNMNLAGVPLSKFNPEPRTWFGPGGWRLATGGAGSATGASFWLREVAVTRPWFDVSIVARAQAARAQVRPFSSPAQMSDAVEDTLTRGSSLQVPVGLVLLGERAAATNDAVMSVKLLGVVVQSYVFRPPRLMDRGWTSAP